MSIYFRFVLVGFCLSSLCLGQITIVTDSGTCVVDMADFQSRIQANGEVIFSGSGIQVIGETGRPQLPWQILTVLLPPGTDLSGVTCLVEDSVYEPIEGIWQTAAIPPAATRDENDQVVQLWPQDRQFRNGKDRDVYETDAFWPDGPARILSRGRLDQGNLVQIAVALVQYNPQQSQLQRLTDLRLRIAEQGNAKKGKTNQPRGRFRESTRSRLKELVVNYDTAAADYEAASEGSETSSTGILAEGSEILPAANLGATGYAIITTNAFVSASTKLNAFIAHKQSLGFMVHLITETDFGGGTGQASADNLRSWLQGHYLSLDLLYVLLIGNPNPAAGGLAMKMVYDGDHPTDYYFAELTGNWDADGDGIYGEKSEMDKFFEVYVGRIPYYGITVDTDAVLQKIMDYENNTDRQWRRRVLLPMVPLDDDVASYELGEQIRSNLLEPEKIDSDRIYDETYGVEPPPEYLRAASYPATVWSQNPYGLVVWQTHGWDDSAAGIIENGDVWMLNDSYPAATWQASCRNSWAENSDTLSWRMLKKGAVATIGATRNSYYWSGQTSYVGNATIGGMGYEYTKYLVQHTPCGRALYKMKEALYVSNLIQNFYIFNLYGDPSLVIIPEPLPLGLADGREGMNDFTLVAAQWLSVECGSCGGADLDGDSSVEIDDLVLFVDTWLAAP